MTPNNKYNMLQALAHRDVGLLAQGLANHLLILPADVKIRINDFVDSFEGISRPKVRKAFRELQDANFITQHVVRDKGIIVEATWSINYGSFKTNGNGEAA